MSCARCAELELRLSEAETIVQKEARIAVDGDLPGALRILIAARDHMGRQFIEQFKRAHEIGEYAAENQRALTQILDGLWEAYRERCNYCRSDLGLCLSCPGPCRGRDAMRAALAKSPAAEEVKRADAREAVHQVAETEASCPNVECVVENQQVTTPGNIGRGPNNMIWCEACEAIKPIWIDDMEGCDVTAQFDHARDLMCGECRLVIATTYRRIASVTPKREKQ